MDDFDLGELVTIIGDTEQDDAVAAELINKHGIVKDFFKDYAILHLLNGETAQVQIKNLKKVILNYE